MPREPFATVSRTPGSPAFVKTSGGKGLHVVAPLKPTDGAGWDEVKGFAARWPAHGGRRTPTATSRRSPRRSAAASILIDYLRNGRNNTAIVAYGARARPALRCRCRSPGRSSARRSARRISPSRTRRRGSPIPPIPGPTSAPRQRRCRQASVDRVRGAELSGSPAGFKLLRLPLTLSPRRSASARP